MYKIDNYSMTSFKLGDIFSNFSELENKIFAYSKEKYVDLHKRDTVTLDGKCFVPLNYNLENVS